MKSLHSVWMLCVKITNADVICQNLVFSLASKLVLDINKSKNKILHFVNKYEPKPKKYETIHYFYLGFCFA